MRWQILAVVGYVISMSWATMLAPTEAAWPTVIILHAAFALGWLCCSHSA